MPTIKAKVIEWIQSLPDDCTLEDLKYHLYVRDAVEQGLQDIKEGRILSQEEVKRRVNEWFASPRMRGGLTSDDPT
jgi:predicted transcriptional regulator